MVTQMATQTTIFTPILGYKKDGYFCNHLIFRAESGTRTRDLFITSETLYHLSYFGTATDVDSAFVAQRYNAKLKVES